MAFPHKLSGLTIRESIADALHRAVAAYDENDFSLLASAFTPDIEFEIVGQTTMHGLDAVKPNFDQVGPMDTTHFVTNVRVNVAGEDATTATATANVLAQHYPTGTGPLDGERRLLAGTKYRVELVKVEEEELWKIKKLMLTIVWREGDWAVMQS